MQTGYEQLETRRMDANLSAKDMRQLAIGWHQERRAYGKASALRVRKTDNVPCVYVSCTECNCCTSSWRHDAWIAWNM